MNKKEIISELITDFVNYHWSHGLNVVQLKGSMVLVCKHCAPDAALMIEHMHEKIKEG